MGDAKLRLILSTVSNEQQAKDLAKSWVLSRRAACVTVLPGARSTYRWEGELCEESEILLLIKSAWATREEGEARIKDFAEDHPYDEPEFIVLDADAAASGYAAWVLRACADEDSRIDSD